MKRRGLKSPDLADALVLTFAAPVRRETELEKTAAAYGNGKANMCTTEYDLFD